MNATGAYGPRLICSMKIRELHPWDVSFQEAVRIQNALSPSLDLIPMANPIRFIAGTDVAFS